MKIPHLSSKFITINNNTQPISETDTNANSSLNNAGSESKTYKISIDLIYNMLLNP